MPEVLGWGIAVLLFAYGLYSYKTARSTRQRLQEYKELFELADSSQKETQSKVEGLLQDLGRKDVLLERSSQAILVAETQLTSLMETVAILQTKVAFEDEQYSKLLSQKKSSEVRTGKITEQIAPFLEDYPLNPRTARFIGDPIDFVHFDEEMVTFVEVKSGKSQLSKKQRHIRDLIKQGKVEFIIYRVEGK